MIPRGKGVFQLFCYVASVGLGGAYRVCIFRSRWVLLHWSVVWCCVDRCTHTFSHVHFSLNAHCRIRKLNSILTSYTIHPNKHILKFSSLLTQRVDVQTTPRTDVPASPRLLLPHRTTTHTTHRRNLEHYLKPYPKSFTCLPDSPAAIHTPNRLAATANIPVKDFELPRRLAAFHAGVNKEL
jgi:hypothetical protein